MISLSAFPHDPRWTIVSFPSTLHLHPILDLLLSRVPGNWHGEVRLGLQEALVNAAKHGNNLDPRKVICIRFSPVPGGYCWIITDEGQGFNPSGACPHSTHEGLHSEEHEKECGRGLYILHCIFDQVQWSADGRELMLYKRVPRWHWFPRAIPLLQEVTKLTAVGSLFWNS